MSFREKWTRRRFVMTGVLASVGGACVVLFRKMSPVSITESSSLAQENPERPLLPNLAALIAARGLCTGRQQVTVAGFHRANDGGGGVFIWNPQGTGHNGGTVIDPLVSEAPGTGNWWLPNRHVGVWERQFSSSQIDGRWFGLFPSETVDYSAALARITKCVSNLKKGLYLPAGLYCTRNLIIYNGLTQFICDGVLRSIGTPDPNGIIQLPGPRSGLPAVQNCIVRANIDMSTGAYAGIMADGCVGCTFDGNSIYGFTELGDKPGTDVHRYGICLDHGSSQNKITRNRIVGKVSPAGRHMLIVSRGNTVAAGGFFSNRGILVPSTAPAKGNLIAGNTLQDGSYGVLLSGAEDNDVSENTVSGPNHRGFYVMASRNNSIRSNLVTGYRSTGILLAYGTVRTTVTNNRFLDGNTRFPPSDEASINLNTGASYNLIEGNTVDSQRTFGGYIGPCCVQNTFRNNSISGFNRAGIALEPDWRANPQSSPYAKSNYAEPTGDENGSNPTARWAYFDQANNLIEGNKIGAPKPLPGHPTCGITILQKATAQPVKSVHNTFRNNTITSAALTHYLYISEETVGAVYAIGFYGNTFPDRNPAKVYLKRGRGHFTADSQSFS